MKQFRPFSFIRVLLSGMAVAALVGCAGGANSPKPTELGPNPALLGVRTAWSGKVGVVDFPLSVSVNGSMVTLASSDGVLASLNARSGIEQWRTNIGAAIAAGVGSDGRYAAVVTRGNELVTLDAGRELWRARMSAQVFTAPLVAGARVFVLGADRSVAAFDAQSGRKLWQFQRPGEALVLRQAGVLTAVGNTLVAGLSGRLLGINPLNGNILWDAPIATPRGTNDIERMVDIVAGVGRDGNELCVRAFQAAVACVDTTQGSVTWKKSASGAVGLQADDKLIFGVESDGRVMAWQRSNGEQTWVSDRLRYRQLSTPLVIGRSVVLGDELGLLHFMSRADGSPLNRLTTDGSAIAVTPVMAAGTLVVVTRNGGVYGFQPE